MKTHPTDLVSFVPGVIAVAIAVVALAGGLTVDALSTEWVWPTVLVGLGLMVLATAGIGRRVPTSAPTDDTADADAEPDDTPADTDVPACGRDQ